MKKSDVLAAASVAFLSFSYTWAGLLRGTEDFFRKVPPTRNLVIVTFCVSLLTLGILAVRWLIGRHPKVHAWFWWLPWLPLLVALDLWRVRSGLALPRFVTVIDGLAAGVVLIVLIGSVCGFRRQIEATIRAFALLVSPVIALTLFQAFLLPVIVRRQPSLMPVQHSDRPKGTPGRAVLILFDELDQFKTFEQRAQDVQLEQFDALRRQAIYAENAYSPGPGTMLTVPSYVLGRRLSRVETKDFNVAIGTDGDTHETFDLTSKPNLFSRAASAGSRTAVVGWYLPYCRIFSGPAYCSWETFYTKSMEHLSIRTTIARQFSDAVLALPLLGKLGLLDSVVGQKALERRRSHLAAYERVLADAKAHLADPTFDFVYIHFPIPHEPVIFDRHTGVWSTGKSDDYFSNLLLADETLGEVRSVLQGAGLWDKTNVLVVGDHGLRDRPEDEDDLDVRRVPFLLKLSGQTARLDVPVEFDTIILHDLLLTLLQKPAWAPPEALDWLVRHRRSPTPPPKPRRPH